MNNRKVAEIFPPGEFIKEELEARNWSQIDLAEIIDRDPTVINSIIMGKRPINPTLAKAIGDAFGTSAQYWMNLESSYQLWQAEDADNLIPRRAKLYQIAPIKEMIKRHWLEVSGNIEVLEGRVMQFFEINALDKPIHFSHAPRKGGTEEISMSQMAWLYRAKQLAKAVHAKKFSNKSFKIGLTQLKKLLHDVQGVRYVPQVLAESGIRLIILEHLPHTRIDGVAFWLNDRSPVIVLSMRYDRIDYFWYTLFHELGHVANKDGLTNVQIDSDLVGDQEKILDQKSDIEKQADLFATEFLIKKSAIDDFIVRVHPLYGKQKILGFAKRIGVHPGIVVGQLQFKKEIPWSSYRQMLDKVKHIITQSALTDGWGQTPIYNE
ncbi:MAG: helix-turn-helix domain-containing protein [Candidatus Anammoxibacter sp.]